MKRFIKSHSPCIFIAQKLTVDTRVTLSSSSSESVILHGLPPIINQPSIREHIYSLFTIDANIPYIMFVLCSHSLHETTLQRIYTHNRTRIQIINSPYAKMKYFNLIGCVVCACKYVLNLSFGS